MKKIKLPDPFKIRARMEKKENELMETMELLARVVDEKLYEAILPLDLERPYVGALDDIWTHTEEMDYEKAILLSNVFRMLSKSTTEPFLTRISP